MKKIFLLSVLSLTSILAQAQKGWEVGVLGGVSNYFGDLNTSFNVAHPGASGTLVARYNLNNRVSLRGSATIAQIKGDDAWSNNAFEKHRNLSFRTNINEASLMGEFNFLAYTHGSNDEFFTPYLLAGANVFSYNPQAKYNNEWVDLRDLGTEGQLINNEYGTAAMGIIYGGGCKVDLTEKWSLNIEIAGRKIFTDYIDDVSGNYPDLRDVRRLHGNIAADLANRSGAAPEDITGRQRGNGKNNDAYATASIGIVFYFGGLECPRFYK